MAETKGNSFAVEEPAIHMKPKNNSVPQVVVPVYPEKKTNPFFREARVPRKAYNVYMKVSLMDKVKEIAEQKGISASAAVEACLEMYFHETED